MWPALPWACSSMTSLISTWLISSSVSIRCFSRAWATGDAGDCGTALTGVWAAMGCDVCGWVAGGFMGCWPLEGTLGERWAWGVAYGGTLVLLAALDGDAVWRCWTNCWWAGDASGWAKGALE